MEKSKNKDLFKELIKDKIGEDKPIESNNDDLIWQNVLANIDTPTKSLNKKYVLYAIAASISLLFVFGITFYFIKNNTDKESNIILTEENNHSPAFSHSVVVEDTGSPDDLVNNNNQTSITESKNIDNVAVKSTKPDFSKGNKLVAGRTIEQHILPDNSTVTLNKFATINYIDDFVQERNFILEGEAYFEVKNNNTPFYVYFDSYKLEVVGTKFNIRNLSGEDSKEVIVTEGHVKVYANNTVIELKKEEQLILRKNQSPLVNTVEATNYTAWVSGNLNFNNTSLDIVFEILSRQYGKKYQVDTALKHCKFTGDLSNISENEAVLSICLTNSLTTENKNKVVIIKGEGCE